MCSKPLPLHVGHLPFPALKLKLPAVYPRSRASGSAAKSLRMPSNAPTWLTGFDLAVLPMGDWSTMTTASTSS